MPGKFLCVTHIGNGSISEAHNGFIPANVAPSGNPPEPSNKLPNVSMTTSQNTL